MIIGDFQKTDHDYQGWLETVEQSDRIEILKPTGNNIFHSEQGKKEKRITVSGTLRSNQEGKILLVIRTDIDYPQALGKPREDGAWSFSECTLGGVDHQIYAVFIDPNDKPLFRSKIIKVRLERGNPKQIPGH